MAPQACGSAGTTAGLALGAKLSGICPDVQGYMVCDDEAYFYDTVNELYQELGYSQASEWVGASSLVKLSLVAPGAKKAAAEGVMTFCHDVG